MFQPTDFVFFYGRQEAADRLNAALSPDGTGLVIVSGATGVGKSSFVRTALVPLFGQQATGLQPAHVSLSVGDDPWVMVAEEIGLGVPRPELSPSAFLRDSLAEGRKGEQPEWLIHLDGAEGLCWSADDWLEASAETYSDLAYGIASIVGEGAARFIVTVAEHHHAALFEALRDAGIDPDFELSVGLLSAEGIREAIERPAVEQGITLPEDLGEVVNVVISHPMALPFVTSVLADPRLDHAGISSAQSLTSTLCHTVAARIEEAAHLVGSSQTEATELVAMIAEQQGGDGLEVGDLPTGTESLLLRALVDARLLSVGAGGTSPRVCSVVPKSWISEPSGERRGLFGRWGGLAVPLALTAASLLMVAARALVDSSPSPGAEIDGRVAPQFEREVEEVPPSNQVAFASEETPPQAFFSAEVTTVVGRPATATLSTLPAASMAEVQEATEVDLPAGVAAISESELQRVVDHAQDLLAARAIGLNLPPLRVEEVEGGTEALQGRAAKAQGRDRVVVLLQLGAILQAAEDPGHLEIDRQAFLEDRTQVLSAVRGDPALPLRLGLLLEGQGDRAGSSLAFALSDLGQRFGSSEGGSSGFPLSELLGRALTNAGKFKQALDIFTRFEDPLDPVGEAGAAAYAIALWEAGFEQLAVTQFERAREAEIPMQAPSSDALKVTWQRVVEANSL